MKANEPKNYNPEVTNTAGVGTPGEVHKIDPHKQSAYHEGYVHGRVASNNRDREFQEVRDNDNAARGLILGFLLTSLVGLTAGGLYLLNQRNNQPVPVTGPVPAPALSQPASSPSPAATTKTDTTVIEREVPVSSPEPTIIERTVPVTVPVPQPSNSPNQTTIIEREKVVPVPTNSAPDINITVPNSQSKPAPTTEPRGTLSTPASRSESKEPTSATTTTSGDASQTTTPASNSRNGETEP